MNTHRPHQTHNTDEDPQRPLGSLPAGQGLLAAGPGAIFEQPRLALADGVVATVFAVLCYWLSTRVSSSYAGFGDYIHIYLPWARDMALDPFDAVTLSRFSSYPPGYPLLLNLLSRWGGYLVAGQQIAHCSFAALAGASVLLAVLLGRRWMGWAVGLFILLNPVLLWHAGAEWADTPAAACVTWAFVVLLGWRRGARERGALVGLLLAAGYWFRLQAIVGLSAVLVDLFVQWLREGRPRDRFVEAATVLGMFLALAGPLVLMRLALGVSSPGLGRALLNANHDNVGSVAQMAAISLEPMDLAGAAAVIGWGGIVRHWVQHAVLEAGKLEMTGLPLHWLAWGGIVLMAAAGGRAGRLLVIYLALKSVLFGFYVINVRVFVDQLPVFQAAPFFLLACGVHLAGSGRVPNALVAAFVLLSFAANVRWYLMPVLQEDRGAQKAELAARLDAYGAKTEEVADISMGLYDIRTAEVKRFDPLLFEAHRRGADTWPTIAAIMDEKGKRYLTVDEAGGKRMAKMDFFGEIYDNPCFRRALLAGRPPNRVALFLRVETECR